MEVLIYYVRNYHNKKIWLIPTHGVALSTLLNLISSTHRDHHHWGSNQQPQYARPRHFHWATYK